MKNGTEARWDGPLPRCDLGCGREAHYDARTRQGPWGYLCDECFEEFGVGLGTGNGQRLVTS